MRLQPRNILQIAKPCIVIPCVALLAPHLDARTPASAPAHDIACKSLASTSLSGARVLSSEVVAAGQLRIKASGMVPDIGQRLATMPAFCRVRLEARPSPASRIGVEVWLPVNGWNKRFLGTGNGGGAGSIAYEMGMVEGLKRGFAVANTDMGTAPDINTVADSPERWIDFGHRATHEMTRLGKQITALYYNAKAFRSYFSGCSTGGQQALSAAQRYPADYDGILAGDPGSNRTHVAASFVWNYTTLTASPGAALTAGQWSYVSRSVMQACAGKDRGAPGDNFLTDPRRCKFDIASLAVCSGGEKSDQCLAPEQLVTLRRLYQGPVNPRTGERIYPGLTLGSENQPLGPLMQGAPFWPAQQFYLFGWSLGSPFKASSFDFDRDMDQVDARLAGTLNANTSDLSDFARRGGKLLLYSGIADPAVPFADVVSYYDRVTQTAGGAQDAARFARMFLVPGMGHCFGGPGVTGFGQLGESLPATPASDILMRLVRWTEEGKAPDQIIAHKPAGNGHPAQSRPICAYPALPRYLGGDPANAQSFICAAAPTGTAQPPADRYLN